MKTAPKIYLVHAAQVSIPPIAASFARSWPEARLAHLLDDSLMTDLAADGGLTDAMTARFVDLGQYCVRAGADAILFACSAFGPAIEACGRQLDIPVLKPNEALYEQLVARGGRVSLLATFPPSIPSMVREIEAAARAAGTRIELDAHLVEGALEALQGGRAEEHHRLIAAAAARQHSDVIAFAQFSMGPALQEAQARTRTPILTTPDSAVAKLKTLLGS